MPVYREALIATFPELDIGKGICDPRPEDADSVGRCLVYERLNGLEGRCYAQREAYR